MKLSVKDFFSKYDQIRRELWIWSHLLKNPLMENFFCAVKSTRISIFENHDFNAWCALEIIWISKQWVMTILLGNINYFFLKLGNAMVKPAHLKFKTDLSFIGRFVSYKGKRFWLNSQKWKKILADFQI